jgi:hypothetical protein
METTLKKIERKISEQQLLLRTLSMWNSVRLQGIDPEDVKNFGFDYTMMTIQERNEARRKNRLSGVLGWCQTNPYNWVSHRNADGQECIRPLIYNYVRLKDGNKVRLFPMIESPDND